MGDTGWHNAHNAWSEGEGPNWANEGLAAVDDDSAATCQPQKVVSRYLKLNDYRMSVPAGATILGISVVAKRWSTVQDKGVDVTLRFMDDNGNIVGDNKASAVLWGTSHSYTNYGGAADLWGVAWTASKVNDVDFGICLQVNCSTNPPVLSVDWLGIKIYYELAIGDIEEIYGIPISSISEINGIPIEDIEEIIGIIA